MQKEYANSLYEFRKGCTDHMDQIDGGPDGGPGGGPMGGIFTRTYTGTCTTTRKASRWPANVLRRTATTSPGT